MGRTTPVPTLSFGEVYGEINARHETAGFVISSMRPVGPPDDIPVHTHPEGSFTFILSGVQISSACNVSGVCGPRSLIYNPPGTTHRDRFQRVEDGRCVSISVPRAMTDSLPLPEMPIRLQNHEALGLVRAITRECVTWDVNSSVFVEELCLQLLAVTARPEESVRAGSIPAWLTQAQELLTDRCTDSLSITSVAMAVGVHPAHLARNFSRFFKRSPGEHLRRSRVARAAALLAETNLPLVEVALSCGFADQSHFANVFKRKKGLSPAAYRIRFRGDTAAA
jgi:AraC family transcriptional regulator